MSHPPLHSPLIDAVPDHWIYQVASLLQNIETRPGVVPVSLIIGQPQHAPPELLSRVVAERGHEWNQYTPPSGTPEFREAVADWLKWRYGLPAHAVDPDAHVLPVAGISEGLFLVSSLVVPPAKRGQRPVVMMPNPLYTVYDGAATLSGAECVYLPATRETDFLPDVSQLDEATLARTSLVYLSSPANPQGTLASLEYLEAWIALAREHDFVLAVDECYSEIYDREPPPGALQAAQRMGAGFANVLVFHSLSKRSSAAGLRSGFVAGDPALLARFRHMRHFSGATIPIAMPLLAASAALWRDEEHVVENRARYRRKLDVAEEILGGLHGFYRPPGGFFLWLDVGDGKAAAEVLWREAGVRVLPGEYLARDDAGGSNPGQPYIRLALVHEEETTRDALSRVAAVLASYLPARPPQRPASSGR
jgi:N-succinyldiaminopimelate aminotransferase